MLSGHHQEVRGCLRLDIPQGNDSIILIEDSGWYLASHYITEDALPFHFTYPGLETQLAGHRFAVKVGVTEENLGRFTAPVVELHIVVQGIAY